MSGGWAQLHPSAASCLLPSGVKFQPCRHRIPGWGPECPHPAPPFKAHLAAPPGKIHSPPSHPLARRRGGRWEGENTGRSEEPGRLRGTESGRSEFVDTRSRELGGWAEGGSGRGEAGPCLGPWPSGLCHLRGPGVTALSSLVHFVSLNRPIKLLGRARHCPGALKICPCSSHLTTPLLHCPGLAVETPLFTHTVRAVLIGVGAQGWRRGAS